MKTTILNDQILSRILANFYCLIILLFFVSCNQDDIMVQDPCPGELPCIGINDSDKFVAAYANGEPWVSRSDASFAGIHEIEARYNLQNEFLGIIANREHDQYSEYMIFGMDSFAVNVPYNLELGDAENFVNFNSECLNEPNGSYKYKGDSTYLNNYEFTKFDLVNQIAEGTFNLKVINPSCQDTISFNDGRFSILFSLIE